MAGIDVTRSRRYYMYYKCPYCGHVNMEQEEFPYPSAISEQNSNRPERKKNKYARMMFGDRRKVSELESRQQYYTRQINEYHNFEGLTLHCTCEKCGREQPWSVTSRPGHQVMSVTFGILMGAGAALLAFMGSFLWKIAGLLLIVLSLVWLCRNTAGRRKLVREVNSLSPENFPIMITQDNYDVFKAQTDAYAENRGRSEPGAEPAILRIPGVSSEIPNPRFTQRHMLLGQFQSLCIMLGITFCILAGCMTLGSLRTVPIEYHKFTAQSAEDDYVYADITYFLPVASVTSTRGGLGSGKDGYFFYCITDDEENIYLFIDRSMEPDGLEDYLKELGESSGISGISSFYQPNEAVRVYGRAEKIRANANDAPDMVLGQMIVRAYGDPPQTMYAPDRSRLAMVPAALCTGIAFLVIAAGLQVRYTRSVSRGGN